MDSERELSDKFSNVKLFAIQHLFGDTAEWLLNLARLGLDVDIVVGIEYSAKETVMERLAAEGFEVLTPSFNKMESTIKDLLRKSFKKCRTTNKRLLIAEVGGYAVPVLHKHMAESARDCIGAVEETRHGLWLDQKIDKLLIPIFQVAETPLKRLESSQVGEAVATAIEIVLRGCGLSLAGLSVSVLGFGWIGASVAGAIRNRHAIVNCIDTDPIKAIEANLLGFEIGSRETLHNADIIVGATGSTSVTKKQLLNLKDGTFLVSASSKDIEMGLSESRDKIRKTKSISPYVEEITLENGKRINLVTKGFPVNFLLETSVSSRVMDIMFADVFACMKRLVMNRYEPGIYPVPEEDEKRIAKLWRKWYT